jgi:hypothetical protein
MLEYIKNIEAKYDAVFWKKIFKIMQLDDLETQARFSKAAIHIGAQYLEWLRINPDRWQPSTRKRKFKEYAAALRNASKLYQEILADNPTQSKYHYALQDEYFKQEGALKAMLDPYQNGSGYNQTIFINFLELLAGVAEKAIVRDIGGEKAMLSPNILAWWVCAFGHCWPEQSPHKFLLGTYTKGTGYKSPAFLVLVKLMEKVDAVTEQNIATAMRKAVVEGKLQDPTKILLNG